MNVSLVVASGAHEGRLIPITGPQFLIGRDEQCNLRPASQAISKVHCGVLVRDGKVYVKDYGSTNGTLVNDTLIQDTEVLVQDGASLRVGPLDFRLKVVKPAAVADGTPLPGGSKEAAALAAVKATAAPAKTPNRDTTPNPVRAASGTVPTPGARPAAKPAAKPAAPKEASETPAMSSSESVSDADHDRIAAMLLGMDEEGNGSVPDGSTVMDIPSPLAGDGSGEAAKAGEKKEDKSKVVQTREEMSSTANDLLRKYMRRPK